MARIAYQIIITGLILYSTPNSASAADIDRKSAVYITTFCVDQSNGALIPQQGSGVVINSSGYVVTAYHIVDCWLEQTESDRQAYPLYGRIASKFNREHFLSIIDEDHNSDIVILKIEGTEAEFTPAEVCILRNPAENTTTFTGIGFPKGEEYQPTDLRYGNTVGNVWSVAGELIHGMSGGGVYLNGRVVGIVKSGDPTAGNTINKVSPVYSISLELEREAGLETIRSCDTVEELATASAAGRATADLIEAASATAERVLESVQSISSADPTFAAPTQESRDRVIEAAWFGRNERSQIIAVCWENPSDGDVLQREIYRDAVAHSWEQYSAVKFVGWGACAERSVGVRIRIADTGPHTRSLGRSLDGIEGGVVANLSFQEWSPQCRATPEFCIRSHAVHGFGHVLGFPHEHYHPDTPDSCRTSDGAYFLVPLTPYDPESVMNYCTTSESDEYLGGGVLSWLDIVKAQAVYGPPA